MNDSNEFDVETIPVGELFADLQATLTDIFLIKLLSEDAAGEIAEDRRKVNDIILGRIREIMTERFSDGDVLEFLERGYPRNFRIGG